MWEKLIDDLVKAGLREAAIADRIKAAGVQTSQPTINRIKSGAIKSVKYELGQALINLHDEVCPPKSPKRRNGKAEARA